MSDHDDAAVTEAPPGFVWALVDEKDPARQLVGLYMAERDAAVQRAEGLEREIEAEKNALGRLGKTILRAEVAEARLAAVTEALEAIVDLPTVVPDHDHGGVYPPYLEWVRVAELARAALSATSPE